MFAYKKGWNEIKCFETMYFLIRWLNSTRFYQESNENMRNLFLAFYFEYIL